MSGDQGLIRMVYVSRATFKPFSTASGIEGHVAKILETARRENKKNHLVGALYYGDGCFFQCLEGRQIDVDALYERLQKDQRHTDLKVLSKEHVSQIGFQSWEMKYAALEHQIRNFLHQHGLRRFDPYQFNEKMSADLVSIIHQADEKVDSAGLRVAVQQADSRAKPEGGLTAMGLILLLLFSVVVAVIVSWLI